MGRVMTTPELKWATEQRFQFVEYQAFWLGSLNRADLTENFGISVPQASKDLAAYQSLFPKNIRYDHSEKRYFITKDFVPNFIDLNSDKFLDGLLGAANNTSFATEGVPIPRRLIDPYVLQSIVGCVSKGQSIDVLYQSMNPKKPDAIWRRITPHSFISDGLRWHTRAYCHIDGKFKDFLLSRCLGTRDADVPGATREADTFWNKHLDVELVPNPSLSQSQRSAIEKDYGMEDGVLRIPIRRAMLYYFEKRLRLDVANLVDEPGEYPVVIRNKEEFGTALREATA